jgi:hypothetical protein
MQKKNSERLKSGQVRTSAGQVPNKCRTCSAQVRTWDVLVQHWCSTGTVPVRHEFETGMYQYSTGAALVQHWYVLIKMGGKTIARSVHQGCERHARMITRWTQRKINCALFLHVSCWFSICMFKFQFRFQRNANCKFQFRFQRNANCKFQFRCCSFSLFVNVYVPHIINFKEWFW